MFRKSVPNPSTIVGNTPRWAVHGFPLTGCHDVKGCSANYNATSIIISY